MTLLAQVRRFIERHALIKPGDHGVVALSGGPDSLSLLHLLTRSRAELQLELTAVHVDHGLREGSDREAQQALALARAMDVEAVVLDAALGHGPPGNLQQRARQARLGLLERAASERACGWVALAHTASDQAETVLMRVIRGAGIAGLSGMAPRNGMLVRPLLELTRGDVASYIERHSLVPVRDPSNRSRRYFRNRVRHELLPSLERDNPRVTEALCRLARTCAEDDRALEQRASQVLRQASRPDQALDAACLRTQPAAVLHRVLRLAHAAATGSPQTRLERAHLLEMVRLLKQQHGSASLDLPGVRLQRSYDLLRWIEPGAAAVRWDPVQVAGPGQVTLGHGLTLALHRSCTAACHPGGYSLDLTRVRFPLTIRPPLPGDRMAVGPGASRKVARVLMDAKLPAAKRSQVPVILSQHKVVLVMDVRLAHGYAACPVGEALRIHW